MPMPACICVHTGVRACMRTGVHNRVRMSVRACVCVSVPVRVRVCACARGVCGGVECAHVCARARVCVVCV